MSKLMVAERGDSGEIPEYENVAFQGHHVIHSCTRLDVRDFARSSGLCLTCNEFFFMTKFFRYVGMFKIEGGLEQL